MSMAANKNTQPPTPYAQSLIDEPTVLCDSVVLSVLFQRGGWARPAEALSIRLLDHLIIGDGISTSLASRGML